MFGEHGTDDVPVFSINAETAENATVAVSLHEIVREGESESFKRWDVVMGVKQGENSEV